MLSAATFTGKAHGRMMPGPKNPEPGNLDVRIGSFFNMRFSKTDDLRDRNLQ